MPIKHWPFTVPLRLRSIFRGRRLESELDEELQFHLEHKIEEGIAAGLSPDEARYRAMRAMDGLEQRKEEIRDMRRIHWLTDFVDDVHYAVRSLCRTPALTAFVVITLALGIGFTAASLGMVDALLLRPYPVPHPDGVVSLVGTSHDSSYDNFSYREYQDIRNNTQNYDGVIASGGLTGVGFSTDPSVTPQIRGGMMVSGNFLKVLGVEPQIGRGFREDEDRVPGRDAVVVLAWDFWKNAFAGDPTISGKTVRLNGRDFTVIGVTPEAFTGMLIFNRPDFYVPLAMASLFANNRQKNFFEDRDDRELSVKARLKSSTSKQQAQNELSVLAQNFEREYPELNRNRGAALHTQFEMMTRNDDLQSPWKFILMGTLLALAVLLVACTNVSGLLLSRARTRTREIALRLALGAGRFRLIRLLLTESLLLALLGGLGGIAIGYFAQDYFNAFAIPSELPVTFPYRMDMRLLLASLAVSVVSAFVCGLGPALHSTRTDLVNGLKAADVDVPGRRRLWGRNMLVVTQVSISLMLLTAAFLLVRGFQKNLLGGIGFEKDHLLLARVDPRLVQYNAAETKQFYKLLVERVRGVPGVESVALTQNPPLSLDAFGQVAFVPDGFQMPRDRENFTSLRDTIDEGFFETMRIAMLRGRAFRPSDGEDAPRVAIVNAQFARHYWPGVDAVGKHLRLENSAGPMVEIVGVAETVKYRNTTDGDRDFVYLPLAQNPVARMMLVLRSSGDPLQLVKPMKDVVRTIDPNLPVSQIRTFEDLYRYAAVDGPGVAIQTMGSMGAVGLLLSVAGLYGLVAYNVSRRTREIGIRMAIGANRADVLRLVMGKGLVLVGIGTAIGMLLSLGVERLMNFALFNLGGGDLVMVYIIVVPSMLLLTTLAAYLPARRASRIAPTQALRCE